MARASTPVQGILNLRCHEYCDGTEAVFYCPQCSAIFCDSCYNREHEASVRKRAHERLDEVKPICREHQHTLEYFDLTSLKAICITCLTNLQSKGEIQNHVIEKIDEVSTKLCSLLNEKVVEAKAVLKNVEKAAKTTLEMTKRTIHMAKIEIHDFIKHGKRILDEREQSISRQMNEVRNEFLNSEESRAGLVALASRLQENIQQAERVSDEATSISAQFPYLFNKLGDLCGMARRQLENPMRLKITVNLSKVAAAKILTLFDVEAEVVSSDELSDYEEEDATSSNSVRVVIMSDSPSCSHGNQSEQHESPGNHSNNSKEAKTPDLCCKKEKFINNHSDQNNQADDIESPGLYGNRRHEDIESPGNHSNQSEEMESPELYHQQEEDDETSSNYSNQSDLDYEQEDDIGSPGSHGNVVENLQSHRIHGDNTPKRHSNHGNEVEDPERIDEAAKGKMNERPRIHGNHHMTKVVSKASRRLAQGRTNSTKTRSKKGKKRKRLPSEERAWTPTRILRSSTMERRMGGTVPKTRSRRGGELSQEMNSCDGILTIIWADEDSWPFVRLVDKKRCPEYYEKISHPMSLEIMKQRLYTCQYRCVLDFVRDFDQIIENCHVFNKDDSEVFEAGTRLALRFNNLVQQCFPNIENVVQHKQLMDSSL